MLQHVSNNILLFLSGILIFVLPIGHTIALRNTAISLIATLTIIHLSTSKSSILTRTWKDKEIRSVFIILFIFTGWVFFISAINTEQALTALDDIKSGWLTPLLYFFIAFIFALHPYRRDESFQYNAYLAIFIALFVHVLYVDLHALKHYLDNKEILTRFAGLTEGPDKASYITNTLLVFLVSEIVYRLRCGKRLLRVNNPILTILTLLVVLSVIIEGMRNGLVTIVFLGVLGTILALTGNKRFPKRYKILFVIALTATLILPATYSIKRDKRWAHLARTIPIAMDTTNNKYWLNHEKYPAPKYADGTTVELSTYDRISWLIEGTKLTFDNPWGHGFAKNAFGRALREKYGDDVKGTGHSHSGLLDLTIGAGYPGLIIWLLFGSYVCFLSLVFFLKHKNVFALILFFNISAFYSRSLLDSVLRDHMFATFMFINGFVFAIMYKDKLLPSNSSQRQST
jgi:hypothetical protein